MKAQFKEPWTYREAMVFDAAGGLVAGTSRVEHAARIARCVTFCDGMTDADIDYFVKEMQDKPWLFQDGEDA